MFEVNGMFADPLPGLATKNFGPFLIGIAFVGMGTYIRIYDDNEDSKLFSFGLVCLILGSCCFILSICWTFFEYKDRQVIYNRNRINLLNRAFFLNLRNSSISSRNTVYYGTTANNSPRSSNRWFRLDGIRDNQPPSYMQACNTISSNLLNNQNIYHQNLSKYFNHKKTNQFNNSDSIHQLSVLNLENLLPTYEEAIKMSELNESTTKL